MKRTVLRPHILPAELSKDMRRLAAEAYGMLSRYRFAEAIEDCDNAMAGGWHPEVLALKSLALDWTGQHEAAEKARAAAFAMSPGHPKSHYYRAQELTRQGRFDEALEDLAKAISGLPYLAQNARIDGAFDAFHSDTPTNELPVPGWAEAAPKPVQASFATLVDGQASLSAADDAYLASMAHPDRRAEPAASAAPLSSRAPGFELRFFDWIDLHSLRALRVGSPDPARQTPAVFEDARRNRVELSTEARDVGTVVLVEQRRGDAPGARQGLTPEMAQQLLDAEVLQRNPDFERGWALTLTELAEGKTTANW